MQARITVEEEIKSFASLIELDLSSKKRYIPRYDENIDSNKFLQTLALKGLQKRLNGKEVSAYQQRLTYELNIIESTDSELSSKVNAPFFINSSV